MTDERGEDEQGDPEVEFDPKVYDEHTTAAERVLANPVARAAYEDAQQRHMMIKALAGLREASGMTVEEVAEKMGVKPKDVVAYERGGVDPRLSFHQRYARTVGARVTARLTGP